MVAACTGLVPHQPVWAVGLEILVPTVVLWGIQAHAMVVIARNGAASGRLRAAQEVASTLAPLAFAIGGVMLVAGVADGFFVVAAGIVTALVVAVLVSWVALVEILR